MQGDIDLVVSDHSPCTPDLKQPGTKVNIYFDSYLRHNPRSILLFHVQYMSETSTIEMVRRTVSDMRVQGQLTYLGAK
jgi:hypothetical protein